MRAYLFLLAVVTAACAAGAAAQEPAVERAEIKFLVQGTPADAVASLKALGVEEKTGKPADIFYYDTRDQQLYRKGLILRARLKKKPDLTVKFRSPQAIDVGAWQGEEGFKSELDFLGDSEVLSHSFKAQVERERIDPASPKTQPLKELLTAAQVRFAAECFGGQLPWDQLERCGPVPAREWEDVRIPGFERSVEIERWDINAATSIVEVSTKVQEVPHGELAGIREALRGAMEKAGARGEDAAESKTSLVLQGCFRTAGAAR